jgi:hypothetical protein
MQAHTRQSRCQSVSVVMEYKERAREASAASTTTAAPAMEVVEAPSGRKSNQKNRHAAAVRSAQHVSGLRLAIAAAPRACFRGMRTTSITEGLSRFDALRTTERAAQRVFTVSGWTEVSIFLGTRGEGRYGVPTIQIHDSSSEFTRRHLEDPQRERRAYYRDMGIAASKHSHAERETVAKTLTAHMPLIIDVEYCGA